MAECQGCSPAPWEGLQGRALSALLDGAGLEWASVAVVSPRDFVVRILGFDLLSGKPGEITAFKVCLCNCDNKNNEEAALQPGYFITKPGI